MGKVGMFFGGVLTFDAVVIFLIAQGDTGLYSGAIIMLVAGIALSSFSTGRIIKMPEDNWFSYIFGIIGVSISCAFYAVSVILSLVTRSPAKAPKVKVAYLTNDPVHENIVGEKYLEIDGEKKRLDSQDEDKIVAEDKVVEKDIAGNWKARDKNILD